MRDKPWEVMIKEFTKLHREVAGAHRGLRRMQVRYKNLQSNLENAIELNTQLYKENQELRNREMYRQEKKA